MVTSPFGVKNAGKDLVNFGDEDKWSQREIMGDKTWVTMHKDVI